MLRLICGECGYSADGAKATNAAPSGVDFMINREGRINPSVSGPHHRGVRCLREITLPPPKVFFANVCRVVSCCLHNIAGNIKDGDESIHLRW